MSPFLYPIEWLLTLAAICGTICEIQTHGVAKILRATAWLLWRTAEAYERGKRAAVVGFRSVGAE